MSSQKVSNGALGSYPVYADKTSTSENIQIVRIDVGTGTTIKRVSDNEGMPIRGTITAIANTQKAGTINVLSLAGSLIGGSYTTVGNLPDTDIFGLTFLNTTKSTIAISLDDGATTNYVLPPSQSVPLFVPYYANGLAINSTDKVRAKYLDSVAASGAIYISLLVGL